MVIRPANDDAANENADRNRKGTIEDDVLCAWVKSFAWRKPLTKSAQSPIPQASPFEAISSVCASAFIVTGRWRKRFGKTIYAAMNKSQRFERQPVGANYNWREP